MKLFHAPIFCQYLCTCRRTKSQIINSEMKLSEGRLASENDVKFQHLPNLAKNFRTK
jgi:hypothetical protein